MRGGPRMKCGIVLAVAGLVGMAAASASAGPDVTVLIPKAKAKVRAKKGFSRAILLEADGAARRRVTRAGGITHWRFVFDNQSTPKFVFRTAFINYGGRWDKVVGNKSPFVEDLRIPTVPRMTLAKAIAKLRAGGYRRGFFNVTLRRPLTSNNAYKHPLYIFGFGAQAKVPYVGVDIRTGRIRKIA